MKRFECEETEQFVSECEKLCPSTADFYKMLVSHWQGPGRVVDSKATRDAYNRVRLTAATRTQMEVVRAELKRKQQESDVTVFEEAEKEVEEMTTTKKSTYVSEVPVEDKIKARALILNIYNDEEGNVSSVMRITGISREAINRAVVDFKLPNAQVAKAVLSKFTYGNDSLVKTALQKMLVAAEEGRITAAQIVAARPILDQLAQLELELA